MTDKINYDSMKKLFDAQLRTFVQKNSDYGNSFERSLESHGLLASIVRMEDKMNRLSTLAQGDKDAQIASESLVDTLMDLSNYAAMSACWLDGPDDVYNEENLQKIEEAYARKKGEDDDSWNDII
jgi:maleate cis-trans isomerase